MPTKWVLSALNHTSPTEQTAALFTELKARMKTEQRLSHCHDPQPNAPQQLKGGYGHGRLTHVTHVTEWPTQKT